MPRLLCTEAVDQVEAYLDGDLDPIDRLRLRDHLEECSGCSNELELAREVTRCLRGLPLLSCPDDVIDAVSQALSREAATPTTASSRWGRGLAIAAGLVALAVGLGLASRSGRLGFLPAAEPAYDAAQLTQAEQEARLALAYLGDGDQACPHNPAG